MARPKKLSLFNLGVFGVNLVETPIHLQDGELSAAQNAELYREEGDLSIRKRLGISSFATDLGAPVVALATVPLPDPTGDPVPSGPIVMLHGDNGDGRFGTSQAGDIAGIDEPYPSAAYATRELTARLGTQLLYAPLGSPPMWNGSLVAYDFDTGSTTAFYTLSPAVGAWAELKGLFVYEGRIYIAYRTLPNAWLVRLTDSGGWTQATMAQVGSGGITSPGIPIGDTLAVWIAVAPFNDKIWLVSYNNNDGNPAPSVLLYSCDPTSDTWTEEALFTTNGYPDPSLAASDSYLYLAFGGSPNEIWRVSTAGAYDRIHQEADAARIKLIAANGQTLYWMESDFLDGKHRLRGSLDAGATFSEIAEWDEMYEFVPGIWSGGSAYFAMVENRNIGPWVMQKITGLSMTSLFTVASWDGDYAGLGGVG